MATLLLRGLPLRPVTWRGMPPGHGTRAMLRPLAGMVTGMVAGMVDGVMTGMRAMRGGMRLGGSGGRRPARHGTGHHRDPQDHFLPFGQA